MSEEKMIPESTLHAVCASLSYRDAQTEVKHAKAVWENAARGMELAQIRCRLAELKSMHAPLGQLLYELGILPGDARYEATRRQLYRAAFYAVFGHMTELP